MELFHFHDPEGNFGDDLNHWIWDDLLPGWREALPGHLLVGVGTLLNDGLPAGIPKVVMGSGVGYGALPGPDLIAECRFLSVRGPRSAAALGLPAERGIVDPAVMLPELPQFQGIEKSGPAIFVPHHRSVHRHDWADLCARAGVDYVSPQGEAREVIRRLAAAPLVLAESMHAAIIADAFGTPWQPVVVSPSFLPSKWFDWADSVGAKPEFPQLEPVSAQLRRVLAPAKPSLHSRGEVAAAGFDAAPQNTVPQKITWRRRSIRTARRSLLTIERALIPGRLRSFAAGQGQLSDRAKLQAARSRYRAVLEELLAEF